MPPCCSNKKMSANARPRIYSCYCLQVTVIGTDLLKSRPRGLAPKVTSDPDSERLGLDGLAPFSGFLGEPQEVVPSPHPGMSRRFGSKVPCVFEEPSKILAEAQPMASGGALLCRLCCSTLEARVSDRGFAKYTLSSSIPDKREPKPEAKPGTFEKTPSGQRLIQKTAWLRSEYLASTPSSHMGFLKSKG